MKKHLKKITVKTRHKIKKTTASSIRLFQRRIARLLMLGFSVAEISSRLNRTPFTIRRLINKESFNPIADELEQEIHKTIDLKIQGLFDLALRRITSLVKNVDPKIAGENIDRVLRVRQDRMKEILPLLEQQQQQQQDNEQDGASHYPQQISLTPESIKDTMQQLAGVREMMATVLTGNVVDVTPEPITAPSPPPVIPQPTVATGMLTEQEKKKKVVAENIDEID